MYISALKLRKIFQLCSCGNGRAIAVMPPVEQLELPTQSCKSTLSEIIKNELNTENFTCEMNAGSGKGDNYVGVVYRVKASKEGDTVGDHLSVIVKLPPANEARRNQFSVREFFIRESLIYEELIPLYTKFQESKGIVPTENGFYEVPKCYKTIKTDLEEAIFLEDLKVEGFEMFDRLKDATFDHVRLTMEILGKLHALSFAMKDQQPELFEPFTKMNDIFTMKDDDKNFNDWTKAMVDKALTTLDKVKDAKIIEKFETMFSRQYVHVMRDLVSSEAAQPYAVINHGDCWNNNILFKNGGDGVPVEARLLDWQIARYSSPVLDLMYYIFGCTTKKLRDDHYEEFLKIYHNSLTDFLRRLGSDPEKLFPFTAFQGQLKKFGRFGALMAMIVLPFFITHADESPDLDKMSEEMANGANMSDYTDQFTANSSEHIYIKRMSDVFHDMDRLGYLN